MGLSCDSITGEEQTAAWCSAVDNHDLLFATCITQPTVSRLICEGETVCMFLKC